MKTLRQINAVSVLSLILSVSVLAGQVESPGAPALAPLTTNITTQTTSVTTTLLLTVLSLIYR